MTQEQELAQAIANLKQIGKGLRKSKLQKPLKIAAKTLVDAARANVPKSDRPHFRYSTPKIVGKLRAPKGMGKKVAEYTPGNLSRSVDVLTFRKSTNVFVGFKLAKGNRLGLFNGRRVDGYYAAMRYEIGEGPLRRAVDSTAGQVGQVALVEIKKLAETIVAELKIG